MIAQCEHGQCGTRDTWRRHVSLMCNGKKYRQRMEGFMQIKYWDQYLSLSK